MPGQQPENYRRSKLRGVGPQGSGLEPARRKAGRAYKGSDSLHKSSGQIIQEIRSMRRNTGNTVNARGAKLAGRGKLKVTEDHPLWKSSGRRSR